MTLTLEYDFAGLRMAAGELLEESLRSEQLDRDEKFLGASETAREAYRVTRTLDDAYYRRAAYLFRLSALLGDAPPLAVGCAQLGGVAAVRAAHAAFERSHPDCPHCGAPLEQAGAFTCWSCKQRLKEFAGAGVPSSSSGRF